MATKLGYSIRFDSKDIRDQGRVTRGVRGIRLRENDEVVDMIICEKDVEVLTVSEKGYGKKTFIEGNDPEHPIYRKQSRGGKGIINMKISPKTGNVVALKPVSDGDELILISENSQIIRIAVKSIRSIGRATQGVRLKKLDVGDRIVAVALILSSSIILDEVDETEENNKASNAKSTNSESKKEDKVELDENKVDEILKEFDEKYSDKLDKYETKGFSTTPPDEENNASEEN